METASVSATVRAGEIDAASGRAGHPLADLPEEFRRAQLAKLPSTFEARGVAIGFTTPALAFCRIRRGRRGMLEMVVPNLAGGRGVYVIDWRAVAEFVSLTVHDRVLHEDVQSLAAITPEAIRRAARGVAAQGLAGPAASRAAHASVESDEQAALALNVALIVKAAVAAGGVLATKLSDYGREEQQSAIRLALRRAATALRIEPAILDGRIAELSAVLASVGDPRDGPQGPLLRALTDLDRFCRSMQGWAAAVGGEEAEIARFCALVGQHTLTRCRAPMQTVVSGLGAIIETLADWPARRGELTDATLELAWLLDGWQMIGALWNGCDSDTASERAEALAEILRGLPVAPRSDVNAAAGAGAEVERIAELSGHRFVRELTDWRLGRPVADLVARIEAAKARALAA